MCLLHFAGRCWAATTTEGLLIYSLDTQMLFDPFELDTSVTPGRIRAALRQRDFTRAILMAVRLNEKKLLEETLESVPWDESECQARLGQGGRERVGSCQDPAPTAAGRGSRVLCMYRKGIRCNRLFYWFEFLAESAWVSFSLTVDVISSSLPELYVEKVLEFLASSFEVSRHLEFYLIWTQKLLMAHGQKLKSRYDVLTCSFVCDSCHS